MSAAIQMTFGLGEFKYLDRGRRRCTSLLCVMKKPYERAPFSRQKPSCSSNLIDGLREQRVAITRIRSHFSRPKWQSFHSNSYSARVRRPASQLVNRTALTISARDKWARVACTERALLSSSAAHCQSIENAYARINSQQEPAPSRGSTTRGQSIPLHLIEPPGSGSRSKSAA